VRHPVLQGVLQSAADRDRY